MCRSIHVPKQCVRLLITIGIIMTFVPMSANCQTDSVWYPSGMQFYASPGLLDMTEGVIGAVFDSAECGNCRQIYPAWRFMGDLKVDAIIYEDSVVLVTEESQLVGLQIYSDSLLEKLSQIGAFKINRIFPTASADDTLYYDTVWERWHSLPDLTRLYSVRFPREFAVESALDSVGLVAGIVEVSGHPIYRANGLLNESCPNEYPDPSGWYFSEWDPSSSPTPAYGANIHCALNLLPSSFRGSTVIAFMDDGLPDTTHEDLQGRVSLVTDQGSLPFHSHGTMSVGIVAMNPSNNKGGMGIAPDLIEARTYIIGDVWDTIGWDTIGNFPIIEIISSSVAEGIRLAVAHNDIGYNPPEVMVFTKGAPKDDLSLKFQLEMAKSRGMIAVSAAGNLTDPDLPEIFYPAAHENLVISAGSYSNNGERSGFSNWTCDTCPQQVDILVPGHLITTTKVNGGYTYTYNGTSASAPMLAGIIALAKARYNPMNHDLAYAWLKGTANKVGWTQDSIPKWGWGRVDAASFVAEAIQAAAQEQTSSSDSVPCLIITNDAMKSSFEPLAEYRTKQGTRTEIVTTEYILANYQEARDLQEKIRNCIIDYHSNNHLEWVILGGDENIVPFRFVYNGNIAPGITFVSDHYYACLDGDWDYDGDGIFGEIEDQVDLIPKVAVGRLPMSTAQQIDNYIAKLEVYENGPSSGWQNDAMLWGSTMYRYADGKRVCEDLKTVFPTSGFSISEYYDDSSGTASLANYQTEMNAGKGILVNYGMAHNEGWNFFLHRHNYSVLLLNEHVDSLSNFGKPSVVFGGTCYNHKLNLDCLAEHYINHPTGGAIAYLGSSSNDYTYRSHLLAKELFGQLFGNGPKEIGALLNLGKAVLEPNSFYDGSFRHTVQAYTLSGDPQMKIWTALPETFEVTVPDSVITGIRDVTVTVENEGQPVQDAKVCLWSNTELFPVYELGFTDQNGQIVLTGSFVLDDTASIVVTKHNFFSSEAILPIVPPDTTGGGGGGCPTLSVWNGRDYQFKNNLLAHSEDATFNDFKDDAYPIFLAPVVDGRVRMRISENENELTSLKRLYARAYVYDNSQKIGFTNHGDFRVLSGDTLLPQWAVHNGSENVSALLATQDGVAFSSSSPGNLTIRYHDASRAGKLVSPGTSLGGPGGGGIPDDPPPKGGPKLTATPGHQFTDKNVTNIYALDANSNWVLVNTVYPRYIKYGSYTDLSDYFVGQDLTIKMEWTGSVSLDHLPYRFFASEELVSREVPMIVANHSRTGDLRSLQFDSNTETATLSKGERIDMEFAVDAAPRGKSVAIVLVANGMYEQDAAAPVNDGVVLEPNYPNPFNPSTTLSFSISSPANVAIEIFNVIGQKVKTVTDQAYVAGRHQVVWDGTNGSGKEVASGMYFARLTTETTTATKKLMLLR